MSSKTSKVGKRGAVVIPAWMRPFSLEMYSQERQAEFLLSNAVGTKDYAWAKEAVRKMGLDVRKIPHYKPVRS